MGKLPKMYQSEINKNIKNNDDYCIVEDVFDYVKPVDVRNELDKLFDGMGYTSRIGVIIKTNDVVYNTFIIARTSNNIITKDNDIIPINSIVSLQRKNP